MATIAEKALKLIEEELMAEQSNSECALKINAIVCEHKNYSEMKKLGLLQYLK